LLPVLREYARVAVDIVIVIAYARMALTVAPLATAPDASVTSFLMNLPLIFALYLVAGYLRRGTYGRRASRTRSLWTFLILNAVLTGTYYALGSCPALVDTFCL
jgi:hypothetical protein